MLVSDGSKVKAKEKLYKLEKQAMPQTSEISSEESSDDSKNIKIAVADTPEKSEKISGDNFFFLLFE